MTSRGLRRWHAVHSWTSLICTLFLLLLCVTGLPLVFADELSDLSQPTRAVTAQWPAPTYQALVDNALASHPGAMPFSVFIDDDAPRIVVYAQPAGATPGTALMPIPIDTRDATLIPIAAGQRLLLAIGDLHEALWLGLPGTLLIGAMGLLFVAAIVSGVVIYAPFARGRPFADVRARQSRRLRWLDLHNVLGIVLLGWLAVVGVTGVINTLARPLFGLWSLTTSAELKRLDHGAIRPGHRAPLDAVVHSFEQAMPTKRVQTIVYPSSIYGTPHHFFIWSVGDTPLTARMFTVALADGETGRVTTVRTLPWYLRALDLSRPLHFGDYGGLPLKILWALFDAGAIIVLASGVYLWIAKRRRDGGDPIAYLASQTAAEGS